MSQAHNMSELLQVLRKWRLDLPEGILHNLGKDFRWVEAALLQDLLGFAISPDLVIVSPEMPAGTSQTALDVG